MNGIKGLEKQAFADELLSYTDSFSKAVRSTLNGADNDAAGDYKMKTFLPFACSHKLLFFPCV